MISKIGPVLNVHVCCHQDHYIIEIQVRSLFQDRTASWVRIVNHECHVMSKAMIRLLRHHQTISRETDGTVKFDEIQQEEKEEVRWCFAMVTQRLDIFSGKRRRSQEKVSVLFEPLSLPRHSGGIAFDLELQDNVLLPKGFTMHTYHVGNVSEVYSTIRSGLIPGGQSLK